MKSKYKARLFSNVLYCTGEGCLFALSVLVSLAQEGGFKTWRDHDLTCRQPFEQFSLALYSPRSGGDPMDFNRVVYADSQCRALYCKVEPHGKLACR